MQERGEWARLRRKGLATVCAPASQDTSHVGHAGVGVVSLRGAPLSSAHFKRFLIVVVRLGVCCHRGVVGFLHLVVPCGYQGFDREAEKLALTDQLLDAAFGELGVVAREQPCLESTKIPCLAKGISAGLWVDLEAAWTFAYGRQPGVTCKRSWDSAGGSRRDFGWAALVLLLRFLSA